jgi:hypothetical protein
LYEAEPTVSVCPVTVICTTWPAFTTSAAAWMTLAAAAEMSDLSKSKNTWKDRAASCAGAGRGVAGAGGGGGTAAAGADAEGSPPKR